MFHCVCMYVYIYIYIYIYINCNSRTHSLELRIPHYVITLRSVPVHLSDQGIIIVAVVNDRQRIKRIVTKNEEEKRSHWFKP